MNEPVFQPGPVASDTGALTSSYSAVNMDGRRPQLLDHRGQILQVTAGHVDIFAVDAPGGNTTGARHHLFRVEAGEIILDLPSVQDQNGARFDFIAVGSPGADARMLPRHQLEPLDGIGVWIRQLARLVAGMTPQWQLPELVQADVVELPATERRRGPMRGIMWVRVHRGSVRLMALGPDWTAASPPLPLTSGMWIEAGASGGVLAADIDVPDQTVLWAALDQFHLGVVACLGDLLAREQGREARRLADRGELAASQTFEAFDRLSDIIVRRFDRAGVAADRFDPLLAACRLAGAAAQAPLPMPARAGTMRQDYAAVVEIAQSARLRVRQVLLRGDWWKLDAGPLVAWLGQQREPVALIRESQRGYTMVNARDGARRRVDRALASQFAPEAVTFYPPLPSRSLRLRDLLGFSLRQSPGIFGRIALAVVAIGLLSLGPPLITNVLINSIIPRSELDQLVYCALALGLTAASIAGVQAMQGLTMLRLESLIDWKLQAAMVDRLLRLPASLFREYTVGDFVDRSMGIDAARRALTSRALRGMVAGLFCLFSVGLMLYYDLRLAAIAIVLTLIRALAILATSAVRLYYESKNFNAQGKLGGFVLQLLAGVSKLRVAAATTRALAVWSRQFATQKRYFTASQLAGNVLGIFETAYPTVATLIIFAYASFVESALLRNVGSFLAFFSAFGQSMGSIGAWATGLSESLIAIPPLARLRPLIESAAEVSDDRKSPGELSGSIELARVTFRYGPGGPPVLDDVTLKIAPGEYVAIVGPSGSGKSSLFRLLLGFERPESGAVFYDGKSIETLDVSAVRRQLGVVLQSARLATGSIYENICGGVRLPLEQAWAAARMAGLEADINAMPMGMFTTISEGVNTLSGGQRQRIMIARAIARRPRILLFDEATSSLDNRSQAIVSDALGELNVTRVVIAHRLSTVREADRIIMLVNGRIVQSGTFSELSQAAGAFAAFAQRQLL